MNKPKTRIENIVVQGFENEVLIYDLFINKAFCLNQTSAMVWELCDGKHSVEQISQIMSRKLNEPIAEDLVWFALDQFKSDGLLENNDQFEINFGGLTRRQVIKKIGFTSMFALPVIASVVAPVAAATASLLAINAACTASSQCQSNNCIACMGFACAGGSTCCEPGVTGNAPGSQIGVCHSLASCNGAASVCCSNMTALGPDPGICAPGFLCLDKTL